MKTYTLTRTDPATATVDGIGKFVEGHFQGGLSAVAVAGFRDARGWEVSDDKPKPAKKAKKGK